jgi:hypothetical protein
MLDEIKLTLASSIAIGHSHQAEAYSTVPSSIPATVAVQPMILPPACPSVAKVALRCLKDWLV